MIRDAWVLGNGMGGVRGAWVLGRGIEVLTEKCRAAATGGLKGMRRLGVLAGSRDALAFWICWLLVRILMFTSREERRLTMS